MIKTLDWPVFQAWHLQPTTNHLWDRQATLSKWLAKCHLNLLSMSTPAFFLRKIIIIKQLCSFFMVKYIILFVSICLILRLTFQALKIISISFPNFNSQFSREEEMKQFSKHTECIIDFKKPQILLKYSHWEAECNFPPLVTCLINGICQSSEAGL